VPAPVQRSQWFIFPDRTEAGAALFCLPHSGGGASAYRQWLSAFPPSLVVRPVQLPGRESRLDEPPGFDIDEIVDVISSEPRPFAIYGHSFGALVAFEVACKLYRGRARLPERLFLGACRPPPQAGDQVVDLLALSDDEFADAIINMGGTPPEIRNEPALARLVMQTLRSDFAWMARYSYTNDLLLPVPVVALAGQDDRTADAIAMGGWAQCTAAGFILHVVPGGHFFAKNEVGQVASHIAKEWPRAR
jgi:surfactin synthase thioesterase subunit